MEQVTLNDPSVTYESDRVVERTQTHECKAKQEEWKDHFDYPIHGHGTALKRIEQVYYADRTIEAYATNDEYVSRVEFCPWCGIRVAFAPDMY